MTDQIVLLNNNNNGDNGPNLLHNAEPAQLMEQEIIERRDIILENDINNQRYCMPSLDVKFKQGAEYSLDFTDLIDTLKKKGFPVNNCMLFCWDQKREMHVFIANDPMLQTHYLPANVFGNQGNIYIKFRAFQSQQFMMMQSDMMKRIYQANPLMEEESIIQQQSQLKKVPVRSQNTRNIRGRGQSLITTQIKEEDQVIQPEENVNFPTFGGHSHIEQGDGALPKVEKKKKKMMNINNSNIKGNNNNASDKRVKERYIEKVREKVSEWRAMHEIGVPDKDGNLVKMNLDLAANYLGISRKTMDDYYLQLRRAEQLGFDFEKNKSEKMGTLRKFVKDESLRQGNPSSSNLQNGDDSELEQEVSSQAEATPNNNSISNNSVTTTANLSGSIPTNPFGIIDISNTSTINAITTNMRGSSNNLSNYQTSFPAMMNTLGNNQNQQQLSSIIGGNSISTLQSAQFGINGIESTNQLITPYNLQSTIRDIYNSSSQYRQSPGQYQYIGRGSSYMAQEPMIEIGQRNSNSMQFNSQIFNPGSQFLGSQQQNGSIVANQSIQNGVDHSLSNIIVNESMNQSKLHQNEQNRFSNHFSLISFGNNSHFTDERGSINFMQQMPSNLQNISHIEDRQSKGDVAQFVEDNYITTSVHLPSNSNNNSMFINQ